MTDRREFFRHSGLVLAGGTAIAGGAVASAAATLAGGGGPLSLAVTDASPAALSEQLSSFHPWQPDLEIQLWLPAADRAAAQQVRRMVGRLSSGGMAIVVAGQFDDPLNQRGDVMVDEIWIQNRRSISIAKLLAALSAGKTIRTADGLADCPSDLRRIETARRVGGG